jgi:hypothetical protein
MWLSTTRQRPCGWARGSGRRAKACIDNQIADGQTSGGARELLSVRPYKITYVVTPAAVIILEVRHTARCRSNSAQSKRPRIAPGPFVFQRSGEAYSSPAKATWTGPESLPFSLTSRSTNSITAIGALSP